ncbi:hypothetical protein J5U23_01650 [Saccharolobus shibatae B12]|uniref:Uncharacterized protein n=2 Tax=Saccharolobus shibatae TaxID=2286 RepID=A0A8F5BP76_SACSH|nr:hypothetical protein [Saccharolobus shibatae]QXJ28781.1 hypothetical protein J5U23_01650 [Saccharolobus shibatae B12]QXJ35082.1 hypothetical protein J5U22_01629 [Saccharolobus shibatae]
MKKCIRYDLYIEECKPGKDYLYELNCNESEEGNMKRIECNGVRYIEMEVRYNKG